MRSIESIVSEPWFNEKPWLICGTGESMERFKPEMRDQYNIWCVYYSIDLTGWADVFHHQDIHQEGDYRRPEGFPSSYRYCAIRHPECLRAMHGRDVFVPDRSLIISYEVDLENGGGTHPGKIYPTSNSTSMAFLFLTEHTIWREIHTLGIDDGSRGIARGINPLYVAASWRQIEGNEWHIENAANQMWCNNTGKRWVRL